MTTVGPKLEEQPQRQTGDNNVSVANAGSSLLQDLEDQWQKERLELFPDYAVEAKLAEALLESNRYHNITRAQRIFDDLARDGYDRPQYLSLCLAQCAFKLGKYRLAQRHIDHALALPSDQDGTQERTLQLRNEMEAKVFEDSKIAIYTLCGVVAAVGIFLRIKSSKGVSQK